MDVCIPCCSLPNTCLLAQVTICSSLSECVIRYTVPAATTLQLLRWDVSSVELPDHIIFLFITFITQLVWGGGVLWRGCWIQCKYSLPCCFGARILLLSVYETLPSADPVPVVCGVLVVFAATCLLLALSSLTAVYRSDDTHKKKTMMLFTCRVFIPLWAALEGGFAAGTFCHLCCEAVIPVWSEILWFVLLR